MGWKFGQGKGQRLLVNVKQLKYVCAIVDRGSFSSAAAQEGVSVQAVSKAMAELEEKVGEPLFERMSSGVRPTPFCRALAARARRVLDEWDGLERLVRSHALAGSSGDPFRIGLCCLPYDGVERLLALISLLTGKILQRKVDVSLVTCIGAADLLRSGELDALVTIDPLRDADVTCGALGTLASSVLLAEDHPLASRKVLTLDDLADYPVLCPTEFTHFVSAVLGPYRARGLRSEPFEVLTQEMSVDFFLNRQGYSFMVAGNATGAPEGLAVRPIARGDAIPVPVYLTTLSSSQSTDYVEFRRALAGLSLFS